MIAQHGRCCFAFVSVVCAAAVSLAQEYDYTALAQPAYANRLLLTDEQRAQVAEILSERITALAEAKPAERKSVIAASNKRLSDLLTPEQKQLFATMIAGGKLQFNFRQQKWPDVLNWFAQQADLALMMNEVPEGAFSYSDTKEYTPREAIDLLNSVLLSKGFTLLRREKMLLVVSTTDGIPYNLVPTIPVSELVERGRFEIVSVEFPLEGRPIDQCTSAVQELVGKHGRVTPLTSLGKLLVTDTAGTLEAVNVVISSIPLPKPPAKPRPAPKPPAPVFTVYPAPGLDPTTTVETLEGLFGAASIKADPKAEEIHVYAIPPLQDAIKSSLEKMLAQVTGDKRPQLEIYAVSAADQSVAQEQLSLALPEIEVTVDAERDRILVLANKEQQAEARTVLQKLGVLDDEQEQDVDVSVVIYPVTAGQVDTLATLLEQIVPRALVLSQENRIAVRATMAEHEQVRTTIEQFQGAEPADSLRFYPLRRALDADLLSTIRDMLPTAQITMEADQRRLTVFASEADHTLLATTLQQIQAGQTGEPRMLRFYRLTGQEKQRLQVVMNDLGEELQGIKLIVDAGENEIAVWASEDQHLAVSALVEKLRPEDDETKVVIAYPLQQADATAVVEMLREIHSDVSLAPDTRANRVLVTAGLEDQTRLQAVIEQLDAPAALSKEDLRAYSLKTTSPESVLPLLEPLFPQMQFSADSESQQLFATGTETHHQRLESAIRRIDSDRQGTVKSYSVGGADPEQVKSVLLQLVPAAVVSASPSTSQVLVWAEEQAHQRIAEAIEQFAQPASSQLRELKSYPLPEQLDSTVISFLESVVPQATITLDASGRRLICWGRGADHDSLQQVLQEMGGQNGREGISLVVHQSHPDVLRNARPLLADLVPQVRLVEGSDNHRWLVWGTEGEQAKIRKMLESLARQITPQFVPRPIKSYELTGNDLPLARELVRSVAQAAKILDSSDNSRIVVQATEPDHARIAAELDRSAELLALPETYVRVYPVQDLTADVVRDSLDSTLTDGLSIQTNSNSNSLIVRATAEQHQRLESALEELTTQLPAAPGPSTRVYHLRHSNPESVLAVLQQLVPSATLAVDAESETLAVTAREAEHEQIRDAVEQLEEQTPAADHITEIYRFRNASPQTALATFQLIAPQARLSADDDANIVIATASAEDQKRLREAKEKIEGQTEDTLVQVYPVDDSRISAADLFDALDDLLKERAVIQVNSATNSLIVRGSDKIQQELQQAIDAIVEQLPANKEQETRVYSLKRASPAAVAESIEPLVPRAALAGDSASGTLIVTGTSEDHERIKDVVAQLDRASSSQPVMRAYPITKANPQAVYQSVSQAFEESEDFSVTFQPSTGTLFLVASPPNHEVFTELVSALDRQAETAAKQLPKVYTLSNVDGEAAAATLTTLFQNQKPAVSIEFDSTGNSLLVVASAAQHDTVRQSLQEMEGTERQLEVFQLESNDPLVIENAVFELFSDLPDTAAPSVSSDYGSQKLFVRGTAAQVEQIRKLLVRMGESLPAEGTATQTGGVRSIPFEGNTVDAVRQIEQIWPRIRQNRIQVIVPSARRLTPRRFNSTPADAQGVPQGDSDSERQPGSDQQSHSLPGPAPAGTQFVLWQDSIRKAPSRQEQSAERTDQQESEPSPSDKPPQAPIIIVPDEGKITIASPDHEALDQLEGLLRAMSQRAGIGAASSNLAVYLLRNTGAADMQRLLKQLFDEMPIGSGGINDVVVVADERLNALVVYGSRKDRALVEELLEVLDTTDVPGPLVVRRPEVIPLEHTQAERILEILSDVYQTQLTSGGGRRQVQIPKGVSADVASVLQQINAATAGPVLMLSTDEVANAIVMRAPPELSDEIREFIARLDVKQTLGGGRGVRVIRLKHSDSDQIEAILQRFLHDSQ